MVPKGSVSKFECKKVLFNICCQVEVFLPRRTFFPHRLKEVDLIQLKKVVIYLSKNWCQFDNFLPPKNPWEKVKTMEQSEVREVKYERVREKVTFLLVKVESRLGKKTVSWIKLKVDNWPSDLVLLIGLHFF